MPPKSPTRQPDLFSSDPKPAKPARAPRQKKEPRCGSCAERFLSDREVANRYDVSRAAIWRWLASEPTFPDPVKLSMGTSRWKLSELVQFEAKARKVKRKKRSATKSRAGQ